MTYQCYPLAMVAVDWAAHVLPLLILVSRWS